MISARSFWLRSVSGPLGALASSASPLRDLRRSTSRSRGPKNDDEQGVSKSRVSSGPLPLGGTTDCAENDGPGCSVDVTALEADGSGRFTDATADEDDEPERSTRGSADGTADKDDDTERSANVTTDDDDSWRSADSTADEEDVSGRSADGTDDEDDGPGRSTDATTDPIVPVADTTGEKVNLSDDSLNSGSNSVCSDASTSSLQTHSSKTSTLVKVIKSKPCNLYQC